MWHTKCGPGEQKMSTQCRNLKHCVDVHTSTQCFHELDILNFLKKEAFWYVVICLKMEENITRERLRRNPPKNNLQWKWQWFKEFYFLKYNKRMSTQCNMYMYTCTRYVKQDWCTCTCNYISCVIIGCLKCSVNSVILTVSFDIETGKYLHSGIWTSR